MSGSKTSTSFKVSGSWVSSLSIAIPFPPELGSPAVSKTEQTSYGSLDELPLPLHGLRAQRILVENHAEERCVSEVPPDQQVEARPQVWHFVTSPPLVCSRQGPAGLHVKRPKQRVDRLLQVTAVVQRGALYQARQVGMCGEIVEQLVEVCVQFVD